MEVFPKGQSWGRELGSNQKIQLELLESNNYYEQGKCGNMLNL